MNFNKIQRNIKKNPVLWGAAAVAAFMWWQRRQQAAAVGAYPW